MNHYKPLQDESPSPLLGLVTLSPENNGHRFSDTPTLQNESKSCVVYMIGKHPVGFGGYSNIYKGVVKSSDGITIPVALKVLRSTGAELDNLSESLDHEVKCWKPLDHENIAPFYCVVHQSNGSPVIVMPWYENGTADDYLKKNSNINPITIIKEIAAGLEYLHANNVAHGDLKAVNVMIDDSGHARLIDFGSSRPLDYDDGFVAPTASSTRWCAPELLCSDDGPTKASDVYAFASTVLELLTGHVPYSTLNERVVPLTVIRGVRPRRLLNPLRYALPHTAELWSLLEQCWADTRRPSIEEVQTRLRELFA